MRGKFKQEDVAIKLLPLAGSRAEKRLLENEVLILARVSAKCAHACRLYGTCTLGEEQAIVMQLCKGNLRQYIAAQPGGKVPVERAAMLAQDLLRGLAELHAIGIVMADLKPDNVLMSDVDVPLLCDFGISRAVTTTIGRYTITQAIGTPNYMSPEQFATEDSNHVSPASDMWSFGATVLHVLSGCPPWGGKPVHVIVSKVGLEKKAPELPPGLRLPPPLEALLSDCFRARPEDRPTAAEALRRVEAMIQCGQHLLATTAPQQPQQPPHPQQGPAAATWALSYVQLSPSYTHYGDAKDGPLRPGKYGIVVYDNYTRDTMMLVQPLTTTERVRAGRWWYARGALQAVPEAAVPEALRLRPWRSADGRRGVPVCPANAGLGMLVQRGYHWRNPGDKDGQGGQMGILVGSAEDGMVWRVQWASGRKGTYHTGKEGLFELAHVQVHERAGSPVFDGDGSLPGAAVMRGWGWCRGGEDGAPFAVGSLEPCDKEGHMLARWPDQTCKLYNAHARKAQYDICHAVRPGEPVTVFTAREGLKVVRGPAWSAGGVDGGAGVGELLEPVRVTMDRAGIVWKVLWGTSGRQLCHLAFASGGRCELQHAPYSSGGSLELGTAVRLAQGGASIGGAGDGPLCSAEEEGRAAGRTALGVVAGTEGRSSVKVRASNGRVWWYDRPALEPLPGHLAKQLTSRVVLNRDGRAAFPGRRGGPGGDTGRDSGDVFYCGARMGQCRCGSCDGVCGPDTGCPCHACLELTGLRVGPRRAGAAGSPPALQTCEVDPQLGADVARAQGVARQ